MRGLILTCLIAALAACGPLPRPFQPANKASNPLLQLTDGVSLQVLPIEKDTPDLPLGGAALMAARLQTLNLPASTNGESGATRLLQGRAIVQPIDARTEEILLHWELTDVDGERIGTVSRRHEAPIGAWLAGEETWVGPILSKSAAEIAALVQEPQIEEALIPGFPGARFVILPMDFAPGDAWESLPRAMERELLAAGLPVADTQQEKDLLIQGSVNLGPVEEGTQAVAIQWLLIRAADGEEIGSIEQKNRVPAGSLDGRWGRIAGDVARAAMSGFYDIFEQRQAN